MFTLIKLIFYCALLIFTFLGGVKYSDEAKEVANWVFEEKEEEISFKEIKNDLKNNTEILEAEENDDNSSENKADNDQQDGLEEEVN
jgi:hypothetical protein